MIDKKFEVADMAFLGGALGFVDEALAEENQMPEDIEEIDPLDTVSNDIPDNASVRLFRNGHPDLYDFIVRTILKQRKEWEADRRARESIQNELDAMAECEKLLKEK